MKLTAEVKIGVIILGLALLARRRALLLWYLGELFPFCLPEPDEGF